MEVVFLLERTEAVQDKKLSFESVWGCPISGEAVQGDCNYNKEAYVPLTHV